jgi:hypothetical protein
MSAALTAAEPRAAQSVLLRPAPRREPPFDDERDAAVDAGRGDRPLPFHRPVAPAVLPRRRAIGLPDPAAACRTLLIGLTEVAAGHRAMRQLSDHLSLPVSCGLRDELERAARAGRRHWLCAARIGSVHPSEPTRGIAEVAATLRVGERVRAAALRLEFDHGRWCCTRLQLG